MPAVLFLLESKSINNQKQFDEKSRITRTTATWNRGYAWRTRGKVTLMRFSYSTRFRRRRVDLSKPVRTAEEFFPEARKATNALRCLCFLVSLINSWLCVFFSSFVSSFTILLCYANDVASFVPIDRDKYSPNRSCSNEASRNRNEWMNDVFHFICCRASTRFDQSTMRSIEGWGRWTRIVFCCPSNSIRNGSLAIAEHSDTWSTNDYWRRNACLSVVSMATGKNALESISDEKLHLLMKSFLKSLDPVLLKAARRGSTSVTYTDEQLFHSLFSTTNDVAHKYVARRDRMSLQRRSPTARSIFFVARNYSVGCTTSSMIYSANRSIKKSNVRFSRIRRRKNRSNHRTKQN